MSDMNTPAAAASLHKTPLAEAIPKLAERGYTLTEDATHQKVWKGVVNGRIPAVKKNGRYYLDAKGMDAAAAYLGLVAPEPQGAKPRKASSALIAA